MIREHFRGVVWPRQSNDTPSDEHKGLYRYVVVGMIVTDKPIEGLAENQTVLDGNATGMADVLQHITQKEANVKVGDATDVLLNLEILCD